MDENTGVSMESVDATLAMSLATGPVNDTGKAFSNNGAKSKGNRLGCPFILKQND
jgi:hypothetical protein